MERIVVIAILFFGAVCSLEFVPCGEEEGPEPVDFYVYRCHEQPCIFLRGNKTTGNVKFIAAEDTKRIDMTVHVDHNGKETTFAGEGVHKCSGFLEGECMYESGTKVNYFFLFPVFVESDDEDVLHFKITLKNDNGTALTCAKFDGQIVNQLVTKDVEDSDSVEH